MIVSVLICKLFPKPIWLIDSKKICGTTKKKKKNNTNVNFDEFVQETSFELANHFGTLEVKIILLIMLKRLSKKNWIWNQYQ